MSDVGQEGLLAWVERGDRARGGDALDQLAREWRPRVLRFLQSPAADEVEEVLEEALCALCVVEPGQRPRALAPDDAGNPAAWRRRVLRNFLIDRSRRGGRRRHAERGLALGLSNEAEAEAWRANRSGGANRPDAPELRDAPPPTPQVSAPVALELAALRHDVLRALPALAVRRRALLLLALGGDPSPFAGELAAALREDEACVLGRIHEALDAPHDGEHDHLSLAMIRVIWPNEPMNAARETARKSLERAIGDVRRVLGVGR